MTRRDIFYPLIAHLQQKPLLRASVRRSFLDGLKIAINEHEIDETITCGEEVPEQDCLRGTRYIVKFYSIDGFSTEIRKPRVVAKSSIKGVVDVEAKVKGTLRASMGIKGKLSRSPIYGEFRSEIDLDMNVKMRLGVEEKKDVSVLGFNIETIKVTRYLPDISRRSLVEISSRTGRHAVNEENSVFREGIISGLVQKELANGKPIHKLLVKEMTDLIRKEYPGSDLESRVKEVLEFK